MKKESKKNIVGRLGIEVRPVLDGFRRELKRGVLAASKGVEAEVRTQVDARGLRGELNRAVRMAEKQVKDAKVGVDLSGMRKAWNAETREMQKAYKDMASGVERGPLFHELNKRLNEPLRLKVEPDRATFDRTRTLLDGFFEREYRGKIKFDIDTSSKAGWKRAEREINDAFGDHGNYKFKVDIVPDLEKGRIDGALKEIQTEFRRRAFKGENFEIDVNPNMSDHDLKMMGRKLRDFKNDWDDTELEFQLGLDHSSQYIAAARLMWLSRDRIVKLKPLVDNRALQVAATTLAALSGGRLVQDMGRRMWDLVKNLDKAVPTFGALSAGLAGAAAGAVQLFKHTVGVAGSLGHIVQMVGLLGPGFLAAGGVLTAAFVVPMFKASQHIQSILGDWKAMSDEMGSSFWTAAMDDFTAAHERAFAGFHDGMVDMSAAAGKHFGAVSDSISKIVAPRFGEWVAHASAGLEELAAHSDSLATVVDVLGRQGSRSLEDFLGWLGRTTTKYADWLVDAEATGKLSMMIDRGVKSMQDLWRATSGFGRTLSGIYEVASKHGGAGLDSMADGLERWAEVTHSVPFQKNLGLWFKGMGEAWAELKRQSSSYAAEFLASWSRLVGSTGKSMGSAAGKMLSGVLTAFSGFKFNTGFSDFFAGLNDGLDGLVSVWPKVSDGLGELLSFMGSLARGFAPVIGEVLLSAVKVAERLGPTLSDIVESAGPRMASAVRSLTNVTLPFLEALARMVDVLARVPGLVQVVTYGFVGLKTAMSISGVVKALGVAFAGLGADIGKARVALSGLFGSGKGKGLGPIGSELNATKGKLAGFSTFVAGAWAAGITAAVVAVGLVWSNHAQGVRAATDDAKRAFAGFADSVEGSAGRLAAALPKVADGFVAGANTIQKSLSQVSGFLGANKLEQFGQRLMGDTRGASQLGDMFKDMFGEIGELAETNTGQAMASVQGLRDAWLLAGGDAADFTDVLRGQLNELPGLSSGLQNLAAHLGFTADEAGVLKLAASNLNVEYALQRVEQERLATTGAVLNGVLDSSVASFGASHAAVSSLVGTVQSAAPSFVSFSAAVTSSTGEAESSIVGVADNLDAQIVAFSSWADNVAILMQRGVSQGVINEVAKMPGSAKYIAEWVNLSDSEFDRVTSVFENANSVLSGETDGMSAKFQEMASSAGGSFESLKSSVQLALDKLPGFADIAGTSTVQELSQALVDGGFSVAEGANGLVVQFSDSVNPMKEAALIIGSEAAANLGTGFASGDLVSVVDPVAAEFQSRLVVGAQSAASAWGNEVATGIASANAATTSAVQQVTSGLNTAVQTGLNPVIGNAAGATWVSGIVSGINGAGPQVSFAGSQVGSQFFNGVVSGGVGAGSAGLQLGLQVVSGARTGLSGLPAAVGQVVSAALLVLTGANGRFNTAGSGWMTRLAGGVSSRSGSVKSAVTGVVSAAQSAATAAGAGFFSTGANMGAGIARGIASQSGAIRRAAANAVTSAVAAANAAGDIRSPSRKTMWTGAMLGAGVEQGIWGSVSSVENAAGGLVAVMLATLSAGSERASATVSAAFEPVEVSRSVSHDVSLVPGSQVPAVIDPSVFKGVSMTLRVDSETEFDAHIEDVSAGVVLEYDGVRGR